jgi:ribonuclease D
VAVEQAPNQASESGLVEREIVRTQDGLQALVDDLRASGRFGLDTEFAGERNYIPQLCLIQVATDQFIGLVDAQAIRNLAPLWELVADPSIEKVLHAAREDLRLAYYGGGRVLPASVWDTQIAAGLVGLSQFPLSYARLVEALTGVRLAKTETRSDWERRPLTPDQVRYARDDVRYLLPVADRMSRLLRSLDRTEWLREEMQKFYEPGIYEPNPEEAYLRVRGSRSGFAARPTAILRALAAWREREAALRNVPVRTIIRDEILCDVALRAPKRLTDLLKIKNFPPGEEVTLGPDLLAAVEAGRAVPPENLPVPLAQQDEDTPQQSKFIDLIAATGALRCLEHNIAPELALTRATAAELVRTNAVGDLSLLTGWRADAVGKELARVVTGQASVTVRIENGEVKVTIG